MKYGIDFITIDSVSLASFETCGEQLFVEILVFLVSSKGTFLKPVLFRTNCEFLDWYRILGSYEIFEIFIPRESLSDLSVILSFSVFLMKLFQEFESGNCVFLA